MYIYGASDQSRVVIDMIDHYEKIHGVFDDNQEIKSILGYKVSGPVPFGFVFDHPLFIAIGDNHARQKIYNEYNGKVKFATIIHESVIFSRRTSLDDGSVIMEGAIVKVNCIIGKQVIVNTGASIDHDCVVGDFVHIAPQATLCGSIQVGEGTLIGANATILPGVRIGAWCKIGAGSIVHSDLEDGEIWIDKGPKKVKRYDSLE